MKAYGRIMPVFDEPNLVSHAGLAPVLALADRAGLSELVGEHVTLPAANLDVKTHTVIAGMLAGADSIDDLDVLRAGATSRVIGQVRAPSTIGTFLRQFQHGYVLQLAAVNRRLLQNLAALVPDLAGDGLVRVDVDDTIREVHGHRKQGAAFGYSGVRGLNGLLATISTATSAPVVGEFSLRRGNVRSGASADWFIPRALATVGKIAPGRQVIVRGDSAFCTHRNVSAALKSGAWFSFTIPHWPTVTAAIGQIPEELWEPIVYPKAIADPDTGELVSDAHVAEVPFTVFTSKPKDQQVACRLVVRRVKRLNENAKHGQDTLFDAWRYHAFITNSTLNTIDADIEHRQHAVVEQVIGELKGGPLAHLPSGKFSANAAWLGFAVLAFNISRAAATAAGHAAARMATLLRILTATPARIASTGRRQVMHLPARWPWANAWIRLWTIATGTGPPTAAT